MITYQSEALYVTRGALKHQLFVRLRSQNGENKFLLDTGASISTINEKKLKNIKIDVAKRKWIQGVGGKIQTLGLTKLAFYNRQEVKSHTFHVLPDNCGIPGDGILGMDFLQTMGAILDLKENVLKINWNKGKMTLPMTTKDKYKITIPARVEYMTEL